LRHNRDAQFVQKKRLFGSRIGDSLVENPASRVARFAIESQENPQPGPTGPSHLGCHFHGLLRRHAGVAFSGGKQRRRYFFPSSTRRKVTTTAGTSAKSGRQLTLSAASTAR
jgi:hypothetical protein